MPLWKWPVSVYTSFVIVCICTYMEGSYTKEIYANPNGSSIYPCFYICTFKEVVIRKFTFICVIHICPYTEACIYRKRHYGSDQL